MPDDPEQTGASSLDELLRSPLEDLPVGGTGRTGWWIAGGAGALAAAVVLALWLAGGGEEPPIAGDAVTTTSSAVVTTPGGSEHVATTAASGDSVTTTAPAEVVGEVPDPGAFAETVAVPGGTIVMFGGVVGLENGDFAPSPDTWLLDAATGAWTRLEIDGPSPRIGHAMAYDPPSGKVVLFGGGATSGGGCRLVRFCPGEQDAQLWLFDPSSRTWRDVTPPDPPEGTWPEFRYGAAFAFDAASGDLVMFGGVGIYNNRNPLFMDDTWMLDVDTLTWRRLATPDPPDGRSMHRMAVVGDTIVMFGGDGPAGNDDPRLWALDPAAETWTVLSEEGPSSRWHFAMAVDPTTSRLIVAGGEANIFRQIAESVSVREVDTIAEVWAWSEAEGWLTRDPLPEPVFWPSLAADQETQRLLLYDGEFVLNYDPARDAWDHLAG